jgi:hypothetical protein
MHLLVMYDEIRHNDSDIKKHWGEEGETKAAAWVRKYTKLTTWENKNYTKPEQLV